MARFSTSAMVRRRASSRGNQRAGRDDREVVLHVHPVDLGREQRGHDGRGCGLAAREQRRPGRAWRRVRRDAEHLGLAGVGERAVAHPRSAGRVEPAHVLGEPRAPVGAGARGEQLVDVARQPGEPGAGEARPALVVRSQHPLVGEIGRQPGRAVERGESRSRRDVHDRLHVVEIDGHRGRESLDLRQGDSAAGELPRGRALKFGQEGGDRVGRREGVLAPRRGRWFACRPARPG